MGVVKLGSKRVIKVVQGFMSQQVDTEHVLQGCGDEKELLLEAKLLALALLVVGVEHLCNILCLYLLLYGAKVVPHIEFLEVKGVNSLGAPQAKQVYCVYPVARYGCIIGHGIHHACGNPAHAVVAVIIVI